MDLTTLSSLRACRTLTTVVKRKVFTSPIDPFVTSCVSDAQNCGKMQIHELSGATFSSLRACWTFKTVVKCKFLTSHGDPFVTSCVSDAENCCKIEILELAEQPFRHFVRVGRQNCGSIMDVFDRTGPDYSGKLW